jgi:predicted nucleotidyltransferase
MDPGALLGRLTECQVRFLIIGGVAANLHGSARLTKDLDVVYERGPENLDRLVHALKDLNPYPRGAPPGLPFQWSAETLRLGLNFTLETKLGALDIFGEVTGGGAYEDLIAECENAEVFGVKCRFLGLNALIRVKRAAGRPKDFEAIAELEAIGEERG